MGARLFNVEAPLRKGRRNAEEKGIGGGCGGDEPGVKDEAPPPFSLRQDHQDAKRPRGRAQDSSSHKDPLSASGLRQPESTFGDLNERWT